MRKYAVISTTNDPLYSFFLPIVHWCWGKLGIGTCIVVPRSMIDSAVLNLILQYTQGAFYSTFTCPQNKEATYSQVARLYASQCDDDFYITSDADMAVFRDEFVEDEYFNILGSDLVPVGQYPMCYAWAVGDVWNKAMKIGDKTMQQCLDEQLAHEEMENMRGNLWSRDQEILRNNLSMFQPLATVARARPGTQFASHRVDRDDINWRAYTGPTLLDAHLWRPGYTDANFANIMELLTIQYPEENFTWLREYRSAYLDLL